VTTTPVASKDNDTDGLPRLADGENVLLVPPGNVISLVETIERVGKDRRLIEGLQQGAALLAPQFAWPMIARKTTEVYGRVLGVSQS
jgi:glycosyltransferase involved in cell wall biosynthesis